MVSSVILSRSVSCAAVAMQKTRVMLSMTNPYYRHCICKKFSSTPYVRKTFIIENYDDFVYKVMNSDVPVIVNFHAEWCDPCKILSPKLKELVEPMNDVHLAVIDVETNADLVHTFEVKAVPAVIAVRNGLVVDKFIGLVDAEMIENLINKLTGKSKQQG